MTDQFAQPTDKELLDGLQSSAGTVELFRWLRPFTRPNKRSFIAGLTMAFIALAASSVIPLALEHLLSDPDHAGRLLLLLVLLVAVDVSCVWSAGVWAARAAADMAHLLSEYVYAKALESPMLWQIGLRRPSVISRHTSDIDRIEEAVDSTVAEGLPGVAKIVVSLALLFYVEPKVGLATLVATLGFLILNRRIGRGMLAKDKARLDASSDIGALVDESITANTALTGLNLHDWMIGRFTVRADRLQLATKIQKGEVTRLIAAARFTGSVALVVIAILAIRGGSAEAGAIAAALLYVDAVVRGLEAMPPWLREVRLAVTSKRRIERITTSNPVVTRPLDSTMTPSKDGLVLRDLSLDAEHEVVPGQLAIPHGRLTAVVAGGVSSAGLLEVITGNANPYSGDVTLGGIDVRSPAVSRRLLMVTDQSQLMDATVREHILAVDPHLPAAAVNAVVDSVGIGHLSELDGGGLDAPLGTHAARLSVHERFRLILAMAVASSADVVALDEIPVLADPETAAPIISALLAREGRTVLLMTTNSEVAAKSDSVLASVNGTLALGTHGELMTDSGYARIWEDQVGGSVDARILEAIPDSQRDMLRSRLITEHFTAGDTLFRKGSPADRVIYVVTGRVAIMTVDADGLERKVAEIGPGNFCGDVSQPGARHTETVRAIDDTMVRTLSVESWSAGVLGILDSDPVQRRIIGTILRGEHVTATALVSALRHLDSADIHLAIDQLVESGQLRVDDQGRLSISARRRSLSGSSAILDRLGDI